MARERQRSKQRQQQRREQRLAAQRGEGAVPDADAVADDGVGTDRERDPEIEEMADLEVGAPPEDIGRSDRSIRDEHEPPAPDFDTDDESLIDDDDGSGSETATAGPRGVRGGREDHGEHKRGRLAAFLVAVWAELQRVQWPDRRQVTQLTGVVLVFVLIVGAYLGGLDAIFSKLIQAIL
jgi:preprotein translocase subunit SecE